MTGILRNFVREVYRRLISIEPLRASAASVRKKLWGLRRIRYNKQIAKLQKKYAATTPEDAGFKILSFPPPTGTDFLFGFDILGAIKSLDDIDKIEFADALCSILDNHDIDFRVAYFDGKHTKENDEALAYFQDRLRLITLSKDEACMLECGDLKFAFFSIEVPSDGDPDNPVIDERLEKWAMVAKNAGCDYQIVMIKRQDSGMGPITQYERSYFKEVVNLGVDAIVATDGEHLHVGNNLRRFDGHFANTIFNMGDFIGDSDEQNGASIALRVKIFKHEDTTIANKGYIPMYCDLSQPVKRDIVRIDCHNSEHKNNPEIMDCLAYIEDESVKIRDIRNIMTIKDICDVLEVELPEQYGYLDKAGVGKVCARSFEVNNSDVLFFRQPFQDNNDKEPPPLELRLRIVERARNRGARFVFSYVPLDPEIPHIVLDDAREAHIKVCSRLRDMHDLRTIGITGSIGKTSTKDMLFAVMEQKFGTKRNLRNSNTQVNIGMHIQQFRGEDDFFIQEIGGGRPGGASRHSRMIKPSVCVVTNIGDAHIGNFGSRRKIMESKLGIIDGMDENGVLYLNGDDPLLMKARPNAKTVFYAVDNKKADYYAEDIYEEDGKTFFTIVHGDERVPAQLNVLGHYNVLNAVCSYAIGKHFGMTDEEITAGFLNFETSGTRQNLIRVAEHDLFVDCFNASPASVDSSLSVLDVMDTKGKKIAVVGDITGMGEMSSDIHKNVADIVVKHKMDILVCYGPESKLVHEKARANGITSYSILKPKKLEKFLWDNSRKGDVILFKGSSKMKLVERIDSMFGTSLADQTFLDKVEFRITRRGPLSYYRYEDFATVALCENGDFKVKISHKVAGRPVYSIADGAFADSPDVASIKVPKGIRHIGQGSFAGLGVVETMTLPKTIKFVGEGAFRDCAALKKVVFREGLLHLEDSVFENCEKLESVSIPSTVLYMGQRIFANCDEVVVKCNEGSLAHKYCIENGVQTELV